MINKTAQVTEEVVVRTDATERVETVSDTVRRQEVDIDHTAPDTLQQDTLTGVSATTGSASTPAGGAAVPVSGPGEGERQEGIAVPGSAQQEPHERSLLDKATDKAEAAKDKIQNKSEPR